MVDPAEVVTAIKALIAALIAISIGLLTWIWKSAYRRLGDLEKNSATKAELRQVQDDLRRILDESSQERRMNHQENVSRFDRILEKIEENDRRAEGNDKRATQSRHDLLDIVNALKLKVAEDLAKQRTEGLSADVLAGKIATELEKRQRDHQ